MSIRDFAQAIGMTPQGVAYRIAQGHLPAMRLIRGERMGAWIISSQHLVAELALTKPGKKGRPRNGLASAAQPQEKAA